MLEIENGIYSGIKIKLHSNFIFFSKYSHDFIYSMAYVENVKNELASVKMNINSLTYPWIQIQKYYKKNTISYNIDLKSYRSLFISYS